MERKILTIRDTRGVEPILKALPYPVAHDLDDLRNWTAALLHDAGVFQIDKAKRNALAKANALGGGQRHA